MFLNLKKEKSTKSNQWNREQTKSRLGQEEISIVI